MSGLQLSDGSIQIYGNGHTGLDVLHYTIKFFGMASKLIVLSTELLHLFWLKGNFDQQLCLSHTDVKENQHMETYKNKLAGPRGHSFHFVSIDAGTTK